MSEVFAKPEHRSKNQFASKETAAKLLEENSYLLTVVTEQFNKGKFGEAFELQKILHRNLVYLSCLAYQNQQPNQTNNTNIIDQESNEQQQ